MATIRETVDAAYDTLLKAVEAFQEKHFAKHGRFRQMTKTHDAPPSANALAKAKRKMPKKGEGDWADVGLDLSKAKRFSARVDTHSTPTGQAWSLVVEYTQGGETFTRTTRRGVGAMDGEWGKR